MSSTTRRFAISSVALVLVTVTIMFLSSTTHATITNIGIPDYPMCGGVFTITVSASSLTSVTGWQVNFTWATGNLNMTSFSYGSVWTGGTSGSKIIRGSQTGQDNALIGYSFNDGSTYSSGTTTVLFTAIFKPLRSPSTSLFHITTSTDNVIHGLTTQLLNPSLTEQAYTTTDGSWENCVLRPVP